MYLNNGLLDIQLLGRGLAWLDTGIFASLLQASNFVEMIEDKRYPKSFGYPTIWIP